MIALNPDYVKADIWEHECPPPSVIQLYVNSAPPTGITLGETKLDIFQDGKLMIRVRNTSHEDTKWATMFRDLLLELTKPWNDYPDILILQKMFKKYGINVYGDDEQLLYGGEDCVQEEEAKTVS